VAEVQILQQLLRLHAGELVALTATLAKDVEWLTMVGLSTIGYVVN